jgi:hypothetical protein
MHVTDFFFLSAGKNKPCVTNGHMRLFLKLSTVLNSYPNAICIRLAAD